MGRRTRLVTGWVLAFAVPVAARGGGTGCRAFLDTGTFEAHVVESELSLLGVETFEAPVSNLGPGDYAALADPLEAFVPNVGAGGLGFPDGLASGVFRIQSNTGQANAQEVSPGSGLAAVGPGFVNAVPASVAVGADVFAESTDVIFAPEDGVAAVGFTVEVAFTGEVHVAVFDSDLVEVLRETRLVQAGEKSFFGAACPDFITRINVGGAGGELIDDLEAWAGQPAEPCPWDCEAKPDGNVGINDFLELLVQWGAVGSSCDLGLGKPGAGIEEFLAILQLWGPCP